MNISQAAAQTGLSAKQIRDYEKQGLLPPAPRSEAGYRRFLPADLQRLRFIAHAREVGFSLAQIKRLLALACGGLIVFAPRQFAQDFAQSLATSRMQAIWLPHAMTLAFSKKR